VELPDGACGLLVGEIVSWEPVIRKRAGELILKVGVEPENFLGKGFFFCEGLANFVTKELSIEGVNDGDSAIGLRVEVTAYLQETKNGRAYYYRHYWKIANGPTLEEGLEALTILESL
jgi:hypothetical protein